MKKLLVLSAVLVAVACQSAERGKAPFINSRNLMRGARCQVIYPTDKMPHEDVFGEVRSLTISKSADTNHVWVVAFEDFDGCQLSFWTETGDMDKASIVRAISSY